MTHNKDIMVVIVEQEIWTVLSNLAFLIPAIYLFTSGLYVESATFFNIAFWSGVYHLCYNMDKCMILSPENFSRSKDALQFLDFYCSYMCVVMQIIYYMDIYPRQYKAIPQVIATYIICITTYIWRYSYETQIIVFALFVPAGLIHYICYLLKYLRDNKWCPKICKSCLCKNKVMDWFYDNRTAVFHPILDTISVIIGFAVFTGGLLCQLYSSKMYWLLHSLWHCFVAIGATILFTLYNKENWMLRFARFLRDKFCPNFCLKNEHEEKMKEEAKKPIETPEVATYNPTKEYYHPDSFPYYGKN